MKRHAAANGRSKAEDIKHLNLALDLCTAIRRKNYTHFFIIYRSLPRLACCLVNLFIDIYRKQLVKVLVWGFVVYWTSSVWFAFFSSDSHHHCQSKFSHRCWLTRRMIFVNSNSLDSVWFFLIRHRLIAKQVELFSKKNNIELDFWLFFVRPSQINAVCFPWLNNKILFFFNTDCGTGLFFSFS